MSKPTSTFISRWSCSTISSSTSVILPDGCRDLIYRHTNGSRPTWHVSPLFDTVHEVGQNSKTDMFGFRLRPGTRVNETVLLKRLEDERPDGADVIQMLHEYTELNIQTSEALSCLATRGRQVSSVAKELGVTPRTLQRYILEKTNRSPSYWMQLARIRDCARNLMSFPQLAELAAVYGYSDQAHMTREFRRWFGTTPNRARKGLLFQQLISEVGYDPD